MKTIAAGAYAQAGQRCTATSRVVAEDSVADEVTERLVAKVDEMRVGPGLEETSDVGPLINNPHRQGVGSALERGLFEGDTILLGGDRPGGPLEHGCFLEPAVVEVGSSEGTLWQEEIFGPVLAVARASDADQAIDEVNDSLYGLSASVFTSDLGVAMRFAAEVDTGEVAIDRPTSGWDVHLPFGGFKGSGSMSKEQGTEGVAFYTRTKTVAVGYDG